MKLKSLKQTMTVACLIVVMLVAYFATPHPIYASTRELAFDNTNVLDDLRSSKDFNILKYPFDSTGNIKHPEIINVVEYCYSFKANMRDNYGLYLYFYNPQGLDLVTDSLSNKVQIAVGYEMREGIKVPNSYEKFDIKFCNMSTEGNYYGLFYKFKVVDRVGADDKSILDRINDSFMEEQLANVDINKIERRYDVSGIELHTRGDVNATDYTVGGSYIFSGFAKGYGANSAAESNLTCNVRNLETVFLDLAGKTDGVDKRTYWRSNSSSLGEHHQNQLNSVFFAIDKSVLEKYGYILQRIKAEWWEYKTRPTVVIDNLEIYNKLLNYNGTNISENYDKNRGFILKYYKEVIGSFAQYGWSWNADLNNSGMSTTVSDNIETLLPLLFYTNGIKVDDYTLMPETLQHYFETYNKSYDKGHLIINGGHDFSADLFDDNVDTGRTRGKNERIFDIGNPDDYWDIRSYDSTHNWWDKLWDYGFGSITTNDDYPDVSPIKMITAQDMAVSNLSDHLKINTNDVQRFKDYYNSSKKSSEVFIFRYAQTDYFSTHLDTFDIANGVSYNHVPYKPNDKHIADLRQGTQFFDFDILEFTFNKDGEYTVIGVVSSPIDHWSGYTPPIDAKENNRLKLILFLAFCLIVFVLVAILCPQLIGAVVNGGIFMADKVGKAAVNTHNQISKAIKKKRGK